MNFREPQLPVFNYKDAMNADPQATMEGKFNFESETNGQSEITFKVTISSIKHNQTVF